MNRIGVIILALLVLLTFNVVATGESRSIYSTFSLTQSLTTNASRGQCFVLLSSLVDSYKLYGVTSIAADTTTNCYMVNTSNHRTSSNVTRVGNTYNFYSQNITLSKNVEYCIACDSRGTLHTTRHQTNGLPVLTTYVNFTRGYVNASGFLGPDNPTTWNYLILINTTAPPQPPNLLIDGYYNLTNMTKVTTVAEFVDEVNEGTDGLLFTLILVAIFFIVLMVLKRFEFLEALLSASFVCLVLAALLAWGGLVSSMLALAFLLITAIATSALYLSKN